MSHFEHEHEHPVGRIDTAVLHERLKRLTPYPWVFSNSSDASGKKGEFRAASPHNGFLLVGPWCNSADITFLVDAPEIVDSLLDQIERLVAENERLQLTEGHRIDPGPAEHPNYPYGSLVEQAHRVMTTDQGVDAWVLAEVIVSTVTKHAREPRTVQGPPGQPRAFVLRRREDVSGISGTGIVAQGVEFTDGTVALRWTSATPTSVVFHDRGIESVERVHGHDGKTVIEWEETRPVLVMHPSTDPAAYAGLLGDLLDKHPGVPVSPDVVRVLLSSEFKRGFEAHGVHAGEAFRVGGLEGLLNHHGIPTPHGVTVEGVQVGGPSGWHNMPGVIVTPEHEDDDEKFVALVAALLDLYPQSPLNPVDATRLVQIAQIAAAKPVVLHAQTAEFTVTPAHAREEIAQEIERLAANRDPMHPKRSRRFSDFCEHIADRIRHPERYSGVAQGVGGLAED